MTALLIVTVPSHGKTLICILHFVHLINFAGTTNHLELLPISGAQEELGIRPGIEFTLTIVTCKSIGFAFMLCKSHFLFCQNKKYNSIVVFQVVKMNRLYNRQKFYFSSQLKKINANQK